MNVIDTNILLYSVDRNDPVKQLKSRELLLQLRAGPEPTVLLWQVLGETTQQLRRWRDQGRVTAEDFTRHITAFRHLFPLVLPTAEAFDLSLNLSERYSLSHWDSMILGACRAVGATRLYTEDIGAPRMIDGIELVNPFA